MVERRHLSPLVIAADQESPQCLRLLIAAKANLELADNAGRTPLMAALHADSVECVALLLEAKADPNPADGERRIPLQEAKSSACHQLLLEAKASVALAEDKGFSSLIQAVTGASTETLKVPFCAIGTMQLTL